MKGPAQCVFTLYGLGSSSRAEMNPRTRGKSAVTSLSPSSQDPAVSQYALSSSSPSLLFFSPLSSPPLPFPLSPSFHLSTSLLSTYFSFGFFIFFFFLILFDLSFKVFLAFFLSSFPLFIWTMCISIRVIDISFYVHLVLFVRL